MTCDSYSHVQNYVGVRLLRLAQVLPVASDLVACAQAPRTSGGGVPATPSSNEEQAFLYYMPASLATTGTWADVRGQGGLQIVITPEPLAKPSTAPQSNVTAPTAAGPATEGSGAFAPVNINGEAGEVQRIAVDSVRVAWERTGSDGHRVLVAIVGNFSPDQMVAYARALIEGSA